ncbi:hypothetical protein F442_18930, partial [Phytophthora nicotianae P10297]
LRVRSGDSTIKHLSRGGRSACQPPKMAPKSSAPAPEPTKMDGKSHVTKV